MNQQLIDQLVKLATIRVNNPLVNSDGKVICDDWQEGVSMSKLIELTVRECVSICELNGQSYKHSFTPAKAKLAESTSVYCGTLMKKHFGVEE